MLISLLVLAGRLHVTAKELLPLGVLGSLTGDFSTDGIPLATASLLAAWIINNNTDILPNNLLVPIVKDDEGNEGTSFFCTLEFSGVTARGPHFPAIKVPIVVGPAFSSLAIVTSRVTQEFHLPMLSPTATAASLAGIPYFARVVPSDAYQGRSLAKLVLSFGWRQVGVIFASDVYSSGLANAFQQDCLARGIAIAVTQSFTGNENISQQVTQLKTSGVVVFLISGLSPSAELVIRELHRQGMLVPPYVYLFPDGVVLPKDLNSMLKGALQTRVAYSETTPEYQQYANYVNWSLSPQNNHPEIALVNAVPGSVFAYDAVFVAAKTLAALQRLYNTCNIPVPTYPQLKNPAQSPSASDSAFAGRTHGAGRRYVTPPGSPTSNPTTAAPTTAPTLLVQQASPSKQQSNSTSYCDQLQAGQEGDVVMELLKQVVHLGATGLIEFDPKTGERKTTMYSVWNLQNNGWLQIGWATQGTFNQSSYVVWADGTERVPMDRLPMMRFALSFPVRVAFFVLEAIVFFVLAIVIGVVAYYRRYREIRSTSPTLLLILLFGCVLHLASAILSTVQADPIVCTASHWFELFGFTLVLVSLGMKMYKLNILFKTPSKTNNLRTEVAPTRSLFKVLLPLLLVDVALLLGWSLTFVRYGPYGMEKGFGYGWLPGTTVANTQPIGIVKGGEDPSTVMLLTCTNANVTVSAVIAVYKLLCLLVVAGVLYVGRSIPSNFFGVASVAFSLYSLAIATILWTIAHAFLRSSVSVIIQVCAILFLEVSVVGAMVMPRIHALYIEPKRVQSRAAPAEGAGAVTILQREDMELLVANCLAKEKNLQKMKMRICDDQQRFVEERWRLEEELRYASEVPRSHFSWFQRPHLQCPTPQRLALSNESLAYLRDLKDSTDFHRRRRQRRQQGSFTGPVSPALHTLWHPPQVVPGLSKEELGEGGDDKDSDDLLRRSQRRQSNSSEGFQPPSRMTLNRSALHNNNRLQQLDRLAIQSHATQRSHSPPYRNLQTPAHEIHSAGHSDEGAELGIRMGSNSTILNRHTTLSEDRSTVELQEMPVQAAAQGSTTFEFLRSPPSSIPTVNTLIPSLSSSSNSGNSSNKVMINIIPPPNSDSDGTTRERERERGHEHNIGLETSPDLRRSGEDTSLLSPVYIHTQQPAQSSQAQAQAQSQAQSQLSPFQQSGYEKPSP